MNFNMIDLQYPNMPSPDLSLFYVAEENLDACLNIKTLFCKNCQTEREPQFQLYMVTLGHSCKRF